MMTIIILIIIIIIDTVDNPVVTALITALDGGWSRHNQVNEILCRVSITGIMATRIIRAREITSDQMV